MTSFSISTYCTIGTNRPSELLNRICLCVLDMSGFSLNASSWLKNWLLGVLNPVLFWKIEEGENRT